MTPCNRLFWYVTSTGGQALSGIGQIYTAVSGDAEGGERLTQGGEILAGPVLGLSTVAITHNLQLAQQNANLESSYVSGKNFVGAHDVSEKIQSGVDAILGILGVTGAGCHP